MPSQIIIFLTVVLKSYCQKIIIAPGTIMYDYIVFEQVVLVWNWNLKCIMHTQPVNFHCDEALYVRTYERRKRQLV